MEFDNRLLFGYFCSVTTALNQQLDEVVKLRGLKAAEVITEALTAGMKQVYVDAVLGAYFEGGLTREDAVNRIGEELVRRGDEERSHVIADVQWGLRG